jgi:hypothetical protein
MWPGSNGVKPQSTSLANRGRQWPIRSQMSAAAVEVEAWKYFACGDGRIHAWFHRAQTRGGTRIAQKRRFGRRLGGPVSRRNAEQTPSFFPATVRNAFGIAPAVHLRWDSAPQNLARAAVGRCSRPGCSNTRFRHTWFFVTQSAEPPSAQHLQRAKPGSQRPPGRLVQAAT